MRTVLLTMGITSPFATNVPLAVPIYPAYTSTFHLQGTVFVVELVSNTGFAIPTSYMKTWHQWLDYPNFVACAFESPSFMIETVCIVAVVHEPRPVHCIPDFLLHFSTYLLNRQNLSCQIRMRRPLLPHRYIPAHRNLLTSDHQSGCPQKYHLWRQRSRHHGAHDSARGE